MSTSARMIVAACAAALTLAPALVQAAAGDLDPSFDGDGKVVLAFEDFRLHDLATADDASVIVAGTSTPGTGPGRFGVARLTPAGLPDAGFAAGGLATATFSTLSVSATAVALDGDRVVVVGEGRTDGGQARFALARFEADGDADPTFFGVGRLWTKIDVGGRIASDHARDVAVQPDGKIVVVGSADGAHRAVVLRYLEEGGLDATFSGNGLAITSLGEGSMRAEAVVIDDAGRIVLAGSAGSDVFLARFLPNGSPDLAFGSAGRVRVDLGGRESALGLALDARGRPVVVGRRTTNAGSSMVVARFRPAGSLDPRFDDDGWRTIRAGTVGIDVLVQDDGRLVLGGTNGRSRFLLARLSSSGAFDTSFGGDGTVTTGFACCSAKVTALAPGPDGSTTAGGPDAVVARYLAA
ncbi:MAG: hypothetical protein WD096_09750 [Actinomycetota bacterium]